jgi:hypothetical protein
MVYTVCVERYSFEFASVIIASEHTAIGCRQDKKVAHLGFVQTQEPGGSATADRGTRHWNLSIVSAEAA